MALSCKYPKLDGKITEMFGTRGGFASALGISANSVGNKMNGKTPWKQREIEKACVLLNIEKSEVPVYFFA